MARGGGGPVGTSSWMAGGMGAMSATSVVVVVVLAVVVWTAPSASLDSTFVLSSEGRKIRG